MAISRATADEHASDFRTLIDYLEGVVEYLDQLADEEVKGGDRADAAEGLASQCDEALGLMEDMVKVVRKLGN